MNAEITLAVLEGENQLLKEENEVLKQQLDWFAGDQDFWRSRYLLEHPEYDNWEHVESASDVEWWEG